MGGREGLPRCVNAPSGTRSRRGRPDLHRPRSYAAIRQQSRSVRSPAGRADFEYETVPPYRGLAARSGRHQAYYSQRPLLHEDDAEAEQARRIRATERLNHAYPRIERGDPRRDRHLIRAATSSREPIIRAAAVTMSAVKQCRGDTTSHTFFVCCLRQFWPHTTGGVST